MNRPLNKSEKEEHRSVSIVNVPSNKDVVIKQKAKDISANTNKYTFDRAFGPESTQVVLNHKDPELI